MRINVVTPFAEKDSTKALGARWDATLKAWNIRDVAEFVHSKMSTDDGLSHSIRTGHIFSAM